MTETKHTAPPDSHARGALRPRWPTLAGVGFAALVAFDLAAGVDLAPVLAASAVVYLGAAALRKQAAAWPMFFATVVVITLARLIDDRLDATWILLGGGVALAIFGLVRGAIRPAYGLPLQSIALLGFGVAAMVAMLINAEFGGYLVAAGLLGHTAWDAHHYRTNRVVTRSMAEFCMVLDTALAIVIVLVTALP
ncbi:MAG: hypothetical protein ACRDP8_03130 [Actinopolymorphaceae bacterium]